MKLDILAIGAHPDDIELGCGGTLISHVKKGYKVGVIDLTEGEMGTRGSVEDRREEARKASDIIGLVARENLGFRDAHFENDEEHRKEVIRMIRKYRPDILLVNPPRDRHPDHGKAHQLCKEACFLSGLRNIPTELDGEEQEAWRPGVVYSYLGGRFIDPDIVVDISSEWEDKMKAVLAYKTQFYDPESKDPNTWLSSPGFLKLLEGRAVELGQAIGAEYAEGFIVERWIGVDDLTHLK